jgi:hypothetical protein
MCNKLLQLYACDHSKTICTTPCPHAIDTGRRVPVVSGNHALVRSDSTVSSLAPPLLRDDQLRSPPTSPHGASARQTLTAAPSAFRFNPAGKSSPSNPPPGYPGYSPTSPTSTHNISPSFPHQHLRTTYPHRSLTSPGKNLPSNPTSVPTTSRAICRSPTTLARNATWSPVGKICRSGG